MTELTKSNQNEAVRTGAAGRSSQPVHIRYGIHKLDARVGGKTVGEVRKLLQQPLNLDPNSLALVNHRRVSEQSVLHAGDQLEFVRLAGTKGHLPEVIFGGCSRRPGRKMGTD